VSGYHPAVPEPTRSPRDRGGAPARIGVFGGTFDPPHLGHLVTAVNVRHTLQLDVVLFVVANVP
jgi:nicotinate-nucleotide adenylyltransferase